MALYRSILAAAILSGIWIASAAVTATAEETPVPPDLVAASFACPAGDQILVAEMTYETNPKTGYSTPEGALDAFLRLEMGRAASDFTMVASDSHSAQYNESVGSSDLAGSALVELIGNTWHIASIALCDSFYEGVDI